MIDGIASSRRTGPACFIAGWKFGANRKVMHASRSTRAASPASRLIGTPSASSTSADPQRDVNERLPCLATAAPAPTAANAAAVERLRDGGASGIGISGSPMLPGKIVFCQMGQGVAWLDWPQVSSYLLAMAPVAPATNRPCLAVVQHDGARFVGWQRQREGRTVQADFEA